ncbi:components of sensory transduction system [Legionella gratiana]|uniref:diguanylate cyclase n=1 Tax=Legionella gratiana TaxID=45066 RepID=A0A378JE11_9GAMM|nr:GGDEF domain-containing protein [Legionella gratiana]KTD15126.1 components of sensory transduction system [Legionella gratiana]STX46114.1 components of sensory transduction system [Legionella gratiana]
MKQKTQNKIDKESFFVLLKGTLVSIPFNVIGAALLSLDFLYHNVANRIVFSWFGAILFLSIGRLIFNRVVIVKKYYQTHFDLTLFLFLVFIFVTGLTWSAAFFIFLPITNSTQQAILALVLGGLSAGAIASLAIYLAAFYAYVLPMLVPIIIYNLYLLQPDKVITGILYSMFLIMVCITARVSSGLLHTTFKLGREKDILIKELKLSNLKLEKSIEEARAMSITDSLTGLYNRRYFDMIFHNEFKKAQRNQYAINLVLIDIDNFKYINDTFGHPSGDDFLIYVANSLKISAKRANDIVFRLGGDEFALILSNMRPTEVLLFCDALQQRFSNNNQYTNVTMSMGIISIASFHSLDLQTVISAADQTLYQAKKDGKNKIIAKVIN